ncbi:MAG: enoyl-CoA hydratase-related protein [Acidimicrobiia bacterium]
MTDVVLYEVSDHIATVTMNRPEVLNAGNRDLLEGIRSAFETALDDNTVHAIVLTGAGRAFCAGADLAPDAWWPEDLTPGQGVGWILKHLWNPVATRIAHAAKPTVASVNGVAAGGGVGLALACDIVIAAESASFIEVFTPQLAVVPDVGSTWHLPRLVGPARARGMALLGDPLDAARAAEWGLIWECVPDADLGDRVREVANRLGALDPAAAHAVTRVMEDSLRSGFDEQLGREARVNAVLGDGPGFVEGVTAFAEKRSPRFRKD